MKVYHGTAAVHWDDIQANGLQPKHGHGADDWAEQFGGIHKGIARMSHKRTPSVYLTNIEYDAGTFAQLAAQMAQSTPLVLALQIPFGFAHKHIIADERSENDHDIEQRYRCEVTIPAKYIVRHKPIPLVPHYNPWRDNMPDYGLASPPGTSHTNGDNAESLQGMLDALFAK